MFPGGSPCAALFSRNGNFFHERVGLQVLQGHVYSLLQKDIREIKLLYMEDLRSQLRDTNCARHAPEGEQMEGPAAYHGGRDGGRCREDGRVPDEAREGRGRRSGFLVAAAEVGSNK
ncbi:hypothetical protein BHM03_00035228 [Ensete ventricosum]|nr:hypothetical protein BHM03_00035228 [Ensete ventricosum]